MGYFDVITNASCKKAADGQWLFYPHGVLGHGYVIPSDAEFDQLRRNLKYLWIITLLMMVATFWKPVIAFSVWLVLFVAYLIWARLHCRNLARSSEKLTYTESIFNETRSLGPGILWLSEIFSILLILYGVILLIADPSQWLLALVMIVVFAACAFIWARMLRIKQRQAQTKQ